jgi:hypothetical protein
LWICLGLVGLTITCGFSGIILYIFWKGVCYLDDIWENWDKVRKAKLEIEELKLKKQINDLEKELRNK